MLSTSRLIIRKFISEDAQVSFEMNTDPEVMKYIPGKMPDSVKDSLAVIQWFKTYYEKHPGLGVFAVVLKDTQEFIGWAVFVQLDKTDKIEVGYRLKRKYWGFGYATEITKAILQYAFEYMHLNEIYGVTHPDNIASQNVLLKSGLQFTGDVYYYKMDLKEFKIERKSGFHKEFEQISIDA